MEARLGFDFSNQGEGLRGIYKPGGGNDWADAQTREGYLIWIPSLRFAQSLRGKVSSGSISHELWRDVKSAVKAAVEFVVGGAAFIAGLPHGALESVSDLLTGLVDLGELVWKVVKSLFTGRPWCRTWGPPSGHWTPPGGTAGCSRSHRRTNPSSAWSSRPRVRCSGRSS
ncbi:hypothetical protein ACN469_36310 [Corallococcus terminator]